MAAFALQPNPLSRRGFFEAGASRDGVCRMQAAGGEGFLQRHGGDTWEFDAGREGCAGQSPLTALSPHVAQLALTGGQMGQSPKIARWELVGK